MCQRFISLAVIVLVLSGSTAYAQCGCNSQPVGVTVASSYSTYDAPSVADYTPAPYVSNYAPPAAPMPYVSYYSPPASYSAVPYVSYYAPATPYVTYYSPPVAPIAVPYQAYYGVPGVTVYGTPQVYVPGQPVRNVLRAITP